ncbi:MAG TPA: respiratory nitrate reductase subunit gamma [Terriglobales bacterium]|jgi:nitrate reductase gamma subunit
MSVFFLIVVPYAALLVAIGGGIYRFYVRPFSYTSLSSQTLEGRKLYWGSVPWHYGIGFILLAHLLAALFPGATEALLGSPWRLIVIEGTGMGLALFALFGLLVLIFRRVGTRSLPRFVTSRLDGLLLALLLLQTATGFLIALFNRWGGLWYVHTAVPWFWSLARFHPDASTVADLPRFVLFHFVVGFAIIFIFPFTRLVHLVKMPVHYLWRPYQRVVWYRQPGAGRKPDES